MNRIAKSKGQQIKFYPQRNGESLQENYALFLKRKRMEQGKKLEEVCEGICSASYLSRIENSLVQVDDSYFKALFEKLNINYDDIKKERDKNLFHELLIKYLLNQPEECKKMVTEAMETNHYLDLEFELMLLFHNIIYQIYEEARTIMIRLESMVHTFTNQELLFYLYLTALYVFRTNQTTRAYKQILVLLAIEYDDQFFQLCVYDLAVDIFFTNGNHAWACQYYYALEKTATIHFFAKRLSIHKMQMLTIQSTLDFSRTLDEFQSLRQMIDWEDSEIRENYYYHVGKSYFYNHENEALIQLLKDVPMSARLIALLASAVMRLSDFKSQLIYLPILEQFGFTKYEAIFASFVEYVHMKIEQVSALRLMEFIKNTLFKNQVESHHDFLYQIALTEYLSTGYQSSKYKEVVRFMMKIGDKKPNHF